MAKLRRPAPVNPGGIPVELTDQLHPIWRNAAALQAHPDLGRYVDARDLDRLRRGGRVYQRVAGAWLVAHGFESEQWPGLVDWRRFHEATAAR